MKRFVQHAIAVTVAFVSIVAGSFSANASSVVSYDFNTAGELAASFNSYVSSGTVTQSDTGGIGNSGSVSLSTADGVFATKSAYSIGPVGSSYVFVAHMRSVGNGGYSGMGFTTLVPSAANADGYPYRPNDALGISVHGGGFVFHDGDTDYSGNWMGSVDPAVTKTLESTTSDLLGNGSPDDWYKVIFTAVRDSDTTFDTKVEIWPCDSNGTLLNGTASAIMEFNNRAASALIAAPKIYSYFNLSGNRVYNFDDYSVNLAGGASVIEEGMPVVLTDSATESAGTLDMDGTLSAAGDSSVIERGFVYSTESDPTISDDVIVVSGTSTGAFSGTSEVLPNDTYYVRAYATNSAGTSYGSEVSVDIAEGSAGGGGDNGGGDNGGGSENGGTDKLADTGFDAGAMALTATAMVTAGFVLAARRRRTTATR